MYWDVKTVKPLPDYRIHVEIEDGRKGIFDMTPYLDRGAFSELRDVYYSIRWASCSARSPGRTSRTLRQRR